MTELRSRPAAFPLRRGRLLLVGCGAFSVSQLPQWILLLRAWYGWDVRVALTHATRGLVGHDAVAAVSRHPVVGPDWDASPGVVPHQEAAAWADLVIVAPATAAFVGKLAHGILDTLALSTVACSTSPVVIAPSVPHQVLQRAAYRENVRRLEDDGMVVVPPQKGLAIELGARVEGGLADLPSILLSAHRAVHPPSPLPLQSCEPAS